MADMPPKTIHDVIMEFTQAHLTQKLITEITDEGKVGLVKIGKLQDDPLQGVSNLMIHPGDRDWKHVLDTESGPGMHMGFAYEIGGPSAAWRRRYKIDLDLYYDNEQDRDIARRKAHAVLQRLHVALMTAQVGGLKDSYGESAHMIQVHDNYIEEGGGSGTFIWRGELLFEVLTVLEP